ncbi:MAG: hypothetical protein HY678_00280 [Chloroflexi bacterium]|nr:hypothetical protein [Chloroflexota bacterium]
MKRTQVQFDEPTFEALKRRAYERRVSMSTVVREAVQAYLSGGRHAWKLGDFKFIGSVASEESGRTPLSVAHDQALALEIYREHAGEIPRHVSNSGPGKQSGS